jgi:hypothetical protein
MLTAVCVVRASTTHRCECQYRMHSFLWPFLLTLGSSLENSMQAFASDWACVGVPLLYLQMSWLATRRNYM